MATQTTSGSDYAGMTKDELYEEAKKRDLDGRSQMTRDELEEALCLLDSSPDAIELVKRQHEHIRGLMDDFEGLSDRPSKKKDELVQELVTVLTKHARMEELVFYPAVMNEVEGLADEVDEGIEEHHLADLALKELSGLSSDAERFDMKVHVLIEAMRHHLDEEEEDLLPKVERAMDGKRRRELGEAMEKAWRTAPLLPHPSAPQTPPANVPASMASTALDIMKAGVRMLFRR